MPAGYNHSTLIGNLVKDPDLKYIPSGKAVCNFSIAINRKYKDKETDQYSDSVTFIRIITWGNIAENCEKYLQKGSSVFVSGRIQTRTWEKDNGEKQYVTEVVADTVQFLSRIKEQNEN